MRSQIRSFGENSLCKLIRPSHPPTPPGQLKLDDDRAMISNGHRKFKKCYKFPITWGRYGFKVLVFVLLHLFTQIMLKVSLLNMYKSYFDCMTHFGCMIYCKNQCVQIKCWWYYGWNLSPGEGAGHGRAEENVDTEHHLRNKLNLKSVLIFLFEKLTRKRTPKTTQSQRSQEGPSSQSPVAAEDDIT